MAVEYLHFDPAFERITLPISITQDGLAGFYSRFTIRDFNDAVTKAYRFGTLPLDYDADERVQRAYPRVFLLNEEIVRLYMGFGRALLSESIQGMAFKKNMHLSYDDIKALLAPETCDLVLFKISLFDWIYDNEKLGDFNNLAYEFSEYLLIELVRVGILSGEKANTILGLSMDARASELIDYWVLYERFKRSANKLCAGRDAEIITVDQFRVAMNSRSPLLRDLFALDVGRWAEVINVQKMRDLRRDPTGTLVHLPFTVEVKSALSRVMEGQ